MRQNTFFSFFQRKLPKYLLLGFLFLSLAYGGGRLYYRLTDGFLESNIVYNMGVDARWNTAAISKNDKETIDQILSQPFHYLAKGCQSYVFASDDGKYVIKFIKYQRFRPQAWLDSVAFFPFVDDYRLKKIAKKKQKLDNIFTSWKLAYEELQPETGVMYVHLNKTDEADHQLEVYDKMGFKHQLSLKNIEFMLQKKTEMLCPTLLKLKGEGNHQGSKDVIDRLFTMLLSEYDRGYADNDHALMQNTGVDNGRPIHIDVGQFIKNTTASDPNVYQQELFNKTWKFRIWLEKHYPELAAYVVIKLQEVIGDRFKEMRPNLEKSSVGRIPNK